MERCLWSSAKRTAKEKKHMRRKVGRSEREKAKRRRGSKETREMKGTPSDELNNAYVMVMLVPLYACKGLVQKNV